MGIREYMRRARKYNPIKGKSLDTPVTGPAIAAKFAQWLDEESEANNGITIMQFPASKIVEWAGVDVTNSNFRKYLKLYGWKIHKDCDILTFKKVE